MNTSSLARMLAGVIGFAPILTTGTPGMAASARKVLPDGSVVDLQDGATLATEFTVKARAVTLQAGEACFHVQKDPFRPFIVRVGGVEVRAVGTAFCVSREKHKINIVVDEGRVQVQKLPSVSVTNATAVVEPKVLISAGSAVVVFDFENTPLAEVVALLNQNAAVRWEIRDASLAMLPISGVATSDNDSWLRILQEHYGIRADRQGNQILLRKAAPP